MIFEFVICDPKKYKLITKIPGLHIFDHHKKNYMVLDSGVYGKLSLTQLIPIRKLIDNGVISIAEDKKQHIFSPHYTVRKYKLIKKASVRSYFNRNIQKYT